MKGVSAPTPTQFKGAIYYHVVSMLPPHRAMNWLLPCCASERIIFLVGIAAFAHQAPEAGRRVARAKHAFHAVQQTEKHISWVFSRRGQVNLDEAPVFGVRRPAVGEKIVQQRLQHARGPIVLYLENNVLGVYTPSSSFAARSRRQSPK